MSPPEIDASFIDDLMEQLNAYPLPMEGLSDQVEEYYLNLMLNFGNYGALNFLFFGIELIGVFMLYRLKRTGFYIYAFAQIGLAATPIPFAGFNTFSQISFGLSLFWNGIWILMYALQWKHLEP